MAEAKTGKKKDEEPGKKATSKGAGFSVARVRSIAATVVWVLAVLAAAFLAAGALVVALDFNRDNAVVKFLIDTARDVNFLGELKSFKGDNAEVKEVLVNWGICAVVYLVVGKILERLIRP